MQVKFRHPYEHLEQIEGSYGTTPALIWDSKGHNIVNGPVDTPVGPNNHSLLFLPSH